MIRQSLGGNLDVNGNSIVSTSDGNIPILLTVQVKFY